MRMLVLCALLLCLKYFSATAQTPGSSIVVLGNINEEQKKLFSQTIADEIHQYAQTISTHNPSHIYVYPYQGTDEWTVISLHVEGLHHHEKIMGLNLNHTPLGNLDEIRSIVGLDQSLKYISWNSYSSLPTEKILLASKAIAQDYLFLHF